MIFLRSNLYPFWSLAKIILCNSVETSSRSDCPSLMLGIAICCIQHSQAWSVEYVSLLTLSFILQSVFKKVNLDLFVGLTFTQRTVMMPKSPSRWNLMCELIHWKWKRYKDLNASYESRLFSLTEPFRDYYQCYALYAQ